MKLGIIGTGRIATRFVPEARTVDELEIAAVYNPRVESAARFAAEHGIELVCTTLEELLKSVDCIYIASPHDSHYDYVKAGIEAGVHVLCEKPLCFTRQQAERLAELASKNKVVLMEAIKTAYCPGFHAILEIVKSGKIGDVVDVEACFTKLVSSDVREVTDLKYGGSFTELGTYVLLPIVKILGMEPEKVSFWTRNFENGLDAYTKITLEYEQATATGKVGLGVKSEGQLIVSGTKGYVLVPAPWWLTRRVEIHYEDPNQVEVFEFPFEGAGLRYEVQAFVKQICEETELKIDKIVTPNMGAEVRCCTDIGVSLEESAWIAGLMERFLQENDSNRQ